MVGNIPISLSYLNLMKIPQQSSLSPSNNKQLKTTAAAETAAAAAATWHWQLSAWQLSARQLSAWQLSARHQHDSFQHDLKQYTHPVANCISHHHNTKVLVPAKSFYLYFWRIICDNSMLSWWRKFWLLKVSLSASSSLRHSNCVYDSEPPILSH